MAKVIFLHSARLKWCNCCKAYRPFEVFGKRIHEPFGMATYCKACNALQSRQRYQQERELILARQQARKEHPEVQESFRRKAARQKLRKRTSKQIYRGKYPDIWEEVVFGKTPKRDRQR